MTKLPGKMANSSCWRGAFPQVDSWRAAEGGFTVPDLWATVAAKNPDKPFLIEAETGRTCASLTSYVHSSCRSCCADRSRCRLTFRQVEELSNQIAAYALEHTPVIPCTA